MVSFCRPLPPGRPNHVPLHVQACHVWACGCRRRDLYTWALNGGSSKTRPTVFANPMQSHSTSPASLRKPHAESRKRSVFSLTDLQTYQLRSNRCFRCLGDSALLRLAVQLVVNLFNAHGKAIATNCEVWHTWLRERPTSRTQVCSLSKNCSRHQEGACWEIQAGQQDDRD